MNHNPRRKNLRHFKSALRGFSFFSFFHKEILRGWQPHFSSFFSRGQQLQQKVASQRLGTRRISKKIKLVFRDWNVAAWQVQRGADEAEGEIRGQSLLQYGSFSHVTTIKYGRGCINRHYHNPGIAKKGGSDPCHFLVVLIHG